MRGARVKSIKKEVLTNLKDSSIPEETCYLVKTHLKLNTDKQQVIRRTFKLAKCYRSLFQSAKKAYKNT